MTKLVYLLCLCGTAWLGTNALGQDEAGVLEGERVQVDFDVVGTPWSGPTRPIGAYIAVPGIDDGGRMDSIAITTDAQSCGIMVGGSRASLKSHPLVYAVDVKVVDASLDRIRLDLEWGRFTQQSGPTKPAAGGRLDVTLEEGQRVVVDVIDRPAYLDPHCAGRNLTFEMTPSIREDPPLAQRQIAYELWGVHEQPGAGPVSHAWKATGRQGQKLDFEFPHTLLPQQAGSEAGDGPDLKVSVGGQIRGRVRKDGSIDLGLQVRRNLWFVDGSASASTGGGEKRLRLQPGETIRVDVPSSGAGPDADRYGRSLSGHSFGLIITATPLP